MHIGHQIAVFCSFYRQVFYNTHQLTLEVSERSSEIKSGIDNLCLFIRPTVTCDNHG